MSSGPLLLFRKGLLPLHQPIPVYDFETSNLIFQLSLILHICPNSEQLQFSLHHFLEKSQKNLLQEVIQNKLQLSGGHICTYSGIPLSCGVSLSYKSWKVCICVSASLFTTKMRVPFTQMFADVRFAEAVEVVKSFSKSTGRRVINILQLCSTCVGDVVPTCRRMVVEFTR